MDEGESEKILAMVEEIAGRVTECGGGEYDFTTFVENSVKPSSPLAKDKLLHSADTVHKVDKEKLPVLTVLDHGYAYMKASDSDRDRERDSHSHGAVKAAAKAAFENEPPLKTARSTRPPKPKLVPPVKIPAAIRAGHVDPWQDQIKHEGMPNAHLNFNQTNSRVQFPKKSV